jgi:fucose 4-O-acetylase-like acetyltransferase
MPMPEASSPRATVMAPLGSAQSDQPVQAAQPIHAGGVPIDPVLSRKIRVLLWFAIVLVVWVHAFNSYPRYLVPNTLVEGGFNVFNYFQYLISNGLTRFVMPLFFVISGYLFFYRIDPPSLYARKITRRLHTIVVPYLIWNCAGIALVVAARNISWLREFMPQYLRDMTWPQFASGFIFGPASFQLWYLRDLFVLALMSPLIYVICRRRIGAVIWLALLVALWSQENAPRPLLTAEGALFFSLGSILALHKLPLQRQPSFAAWLGAAGIWLALSALRAWMAFDTVPDAQAWILLLYKVCNLMALWVIWRGYDFIVRDVPETSRWWPWFGVSFYIFVAHQPFYNIASDNILARIGHHEALKSVNPGGAFLVYLFLPAATIVMLSALGRTIRERAHPLHRLLTGGR